MSNPAVRIPSPTGGPVGPAPSDNPIPAIRAQLRSGDAAPAPFVVPEPQTQRIVERVPNTGATIVERTPPALPAPSLTSTLEASEAAPVPPPSRPNTVKEAIADAAARTSVDYEYLVAQAELESGLNPNAKARTSTASGLFQFLETTWLATVKKHGPRFGYDAIANQIDTFSNGRPFVADSRQREAILALRNDPEIASLMAAGFAEDNRAQIAPVLGRQPDHSELYLAHFLGAGGARKFLNALQQDQGQSAAAVFPKAAAANRPIFYHNGQPRSLAGVMDLIHSKMSRALARVDSDGLNRRADATYNPVQLASSITPSRTFAGAGLGAPSAPPPYAMSDQATFNPVGLSAGPVSGAVSGAARATSARGPSIARPPASVSMSAMLRATFGGDGGPALATPQGAAQVKRAYDQLKAFGL